MPSAVPPPSNPTLLGKAAPANTTGSTGKKRNITCFSDFDGTIFMQDTGHVLFDSYGCGSERRKQLDAEIQNGTRSFREVSEEMWASLNIPFDDGFAVMAKALEIDTDFRVFHQFCLDNEIPFHVISAGLKPVLRAVLDRFLGEEQSARINIVANDAVISEEGTWKPVWIHGDSELGHDKKQSMTEARRQVEELSLADGSVPLVVFIGDGVSDLPAAREADVLFARRGLRLEEYCLEHGIKYTPFDTFADVQKEIQRIKEEDEKITKGEGMPVRYNPRANLWRRISNNSNPHKPALMSPTAEKSRIMFPETAPETAAQA